MVLIVCVLRVRKAFSRAGSVGDRSVCVRVRMRVRRSGNYHCSGSRANEICVLQVLRTTLSYVCAGRLNRRPPRQCEARIKLLKLGVAHGRGCYSNKIKFITSPPMTYAPRRVSNAARRGEPPTAANNIEPRYRTMIRTKRVAERSALPSAQRGHYDKLRTRKMGGRKM